MPGFVHPAPPQEQRKNPWRPVFPVCAPAGASASLPSPGPINRLSGANCHRSGSAIFRPPRAVHQALWQTFGGVSRSVIAHRAVCLLSAPPPPLPVGVNCCKLDCSVLRWGRQSDNKGGFPMSDAYGSLPEDIRRDAEELFRSGNYVTAARFLRNQGVSDEIIRARFGPSPEEKAAAAAVEAKRIRREARRTWWSNQWVALLALIVAILSLLVALLRP